MSYDINCECFNVNMYHDRKLTVSSNNVCSDFFPCSTGVRQGDNLSPSLLSLFLNDLEDRIPLHDGLCSLYEKETFETKISSFHQQRMRCHYVNLFSS